jgi:uncharacterized phosphosugar-binding protein
MMIVDQYLDKTHCLLSRIADTQIDALNRASSLVADTIERDGIIYSLGSGHSLMIAAELYYRAGGLANFDVIQDRTFGRAERLPGYAETLFDSCPIGERDALIIISNSGRNCLPVEMALGAKQREIPTIGITSLPHSRSVSSRAPQGLRLFEICDIVIDTGTTPGDASIDLGDNSGIQMGPQSTMAGIFIVNCISAGAAAKLWERGVEPMVFVSANGDGAEQRNKSLREFMRNRIRGL